MVCFEKVKHLGLSIYNLQWLTFMQKKKIRPYIYIYSSQSETEEQGIINVSNVRIDYNRALEQMIKVGYI